MLFYVNSNESGELLQWLCHGDSTTNIVLIVIIITHAHVVAVVGRLSALRVCMYASTLKQKNYWMYHQTWQVDNAR